MDRISGILPQIGWSPAMAPVTAEKAPATTVEALSASSSAQSGMQANVDTQTGENRAAQIAAMLRNTGTSAESTILAKSEKIDPDAPAGPPPTFDVSPLEAKVAELSNPEHMKAKTEENASTRPDATAAGEEGDAKQDASQAEAGDDRAAAKTTAEWQTLDAIAQGQSLDLLR